jgi:hypothetical protein
MGQLSPRVAIDRRPMILLLLMVRRRVREPTARDQDLTRSYRKFLARVTEPGTARLADRVPEQGREAHMGEILGDFIDQVRAEG